MALKKKIILDNGIIVNYHRIVSINEMINNSIIIQIASYINENERKKEIDYYNSLDEDKRINVFIESTIINKEYSENENIKDIYNYLKTIEKFKDAEDC